RQPERPAPAPPPAPQEPRREEPVEPQRREAEAAEAATEEAAPKEVSSKWIWLLVSGLVVAALALGIWLSTGNRSGGSSPSPAVSSSSAPTQGASAVQPAPPVPLGPPALRGTVKDASDTIVPGTVVKVMHPDGREIAEATTDDNGRYNFPSLPTGIARVSFECKGFEKLTYTRVDLKNGQVKRLSPQLRVGAASMEIEIGVRQ
ncbi:MAG: carboxypeptidase-like regulatory domain-containing protein, partial [Terracidiphilus sp.]